jgi:hypothetical protein
MYNLSRSASLGILGALGAITSGTYIFSKIKSKGIPSQFIMNGIAALIDFGYLIWFTYFNYTNNKLFDYDDIQLIYTLVFSIVLIACSLLFLFGGLKLDSGKNVMIYLTRFFVGFMLLIFAFTRNNDYSVYPPLAVVASMLLLVELY